MDGGTESRPLGKAESVLEEATEGSKESRTVKADPCCQRALDHPKLGLAKPPSGRLPTAVRIWPAASF